MIWVKIVLTTHPSLAKQHYTHRAERKRHTAVVATTGQALGGGHEESVVVKKFRCQFENESIWKCCAVFFRSSSTCICQDPRVARAYSAQNTKKKSTPRLPCSASIRAHVEVRNGYGRARGVGAAPRSRRYLTEDSGSVNRILRPRQKETPDRIPEKKNDLIYMYKGSAYFGWGREGVGIVPSDINKN